MSEPIDKLRRQQPRNRVLRISLLVLGGLTVYAWASGDVEVAKLLQPRRLDNLVRFVTVELVPQPLRETGFQIKALCVWAGSIMAREGWTGIQATLAICILAIVLAGAGGAAFCLPAARSFMAPEPFLPAGREPGAVFGILVSLVRVFLLFLRSIPEYIWAYFFLVMFGPSAWPAVLALALHNTGILGKLNAEVVENLEPGTLRALRALGATRWQIAASAIFPIAMPRFMLYFFYRFETCVREATVLGMVGIISLGYYIDVARSNLYYDRMIFLVLLGAVLVLAADLVSTVARRMVRSAV